MRDSKARVTIETDDGGKLKGETPPMQPIRLFFLTFPVLYPALWI